MGNVCGSLPKYVGIVSLFALQGMSMPNSSRAACYSTPRAAIDAIIANPSFSPASKNDGYRVARIESDRVLGQRWAMIARCGHPEWPVVALPANAPSLVSLTREAMRSTIESL